MFQDHTINKCYVRFTAAPGVKKELIQGSLANEKDNIMNVVGDIFSEYFPGNTWIDIDHIHLDLGTITPSDFPEEYKSRIKKLLIPEIQKLLKKEEFQKQIKTSSHKTSEDLFGLFENYFDNGFNAVLQKDKDFSPDDLVLNLIEKDPNKLIALVEKRLKQENFRRRLKRLNKETLHRIAEILPEDFQEEFKKNEVTFYSDRSFEIITHYFFTGQFLGEASVLSPVDIEFLVGKLTHHQKRKLAVVLLANLSDPIFIHRLSGSLLFETVYSCFETLESQKKMLEEWDFIQSFFFKENDSSVFPSYRLFFLEFMKIPFSDHHRRGELIYKYVSAHRHTVKEIKEWSRFYQTIQEEKIPKTHVGLLKYLEGKISDSIDKEERNKWSGDIALLVSYFRTGRIEGRENISERLKKQLDADFLAFLNAVQEIWKEEGVRYRIAYASDMKSLKRLTEMLAGHHYTYSWWLDSIGKITSVQGDIVSLERRIHLLYFDFLSSSHHQQWQKDQFEQWLAVNLKHSVPEEGRKDSEMTRTDQERFVKEHKLLSDFETILVSFSKEKALQYKMSELFMLSKKGAVEDIQLFFEYYLEEEGFLTEQYFKAEIPYVRWSEIWVSIPSHQLERVLAVIAYSHYQFMIALLDEFKLLFSFNKLSGSFELIRRKIFLSTLQILHDTKGQIDPALLSLQVVSRILGEKIFVVPAFESEAQLLFERMPKIAFAIKKNRKEKQTNENKSLVSFENFRRLITQNFSDLSGFVLLYFSVVHQFLIKQERLPGIGQEQLLLYTYNHLKKSGQTFSAVAFVREINTQIARLFQVEVQTVNQFFLNSSANLIQQGNSGFYVLNEILNSLQKEDSISSIETNIPYDKEAVSFEEEQVEEQFLDEVSHIHRTFVYKAVTDYLKQGVFPSEGEIKFDSEDHFLSFILDFERQHSSLFFQWVKELFSKEEDLDYFLTVQPVEIQNFIIQVFSGGRYEEFSGWGKDTEAFILSAYQNINPEKVSMVIRKSIISLLFSSDRSTVGIFSYIKWILQFSKQQNLVIITPDFPALVEKYRQDKNGTSLLLNAFSEEASMTLSKGNDSILKEVTGQNRGENKEKGEVEYPTVEALLLLVEKKSEDEIVLCFESYLEEDNLFREILRSATVSLHFWSRLSEVLSDSLLERLLVVMTASMYSHIKGILKELRELMLLGQLSSGFEQRVRGKYALLFHTIHESGYLKDESRIEQEFLAAFFSTEHLLKIHLENSLETDRDRIFGSFPNVYQFIQKSTIVSKDDTGSVEEIEKKIREYFPEVSGFVLTVLSVLEEYFSECFAHAPQATLVMFKSVYHYLQKNKAGFNDHFFVQAITLQTAMTHSLYLREMGNAVLKIVEKYIGKGESRYFRLKEILLLQGYYLEVFSSEKVRETRSLNPQDEYGYETSSSVSPFEVSEQLKKDDTEFSSSVISFEVFKQFVEDRFPDVSGFVSTYLIAVEQSALAQVLNREKLLVTIYNYLSENSNNTFSSVAFVGTMNAYVAAHNAVNCEEIEKILTDFSEAKLEQGHSRFLALKEILYSQINESKEQEELSVPELASEQYDKQLKELEQYHRKIQFDHFRKILAAYGTGGVPSGLGADSDIRFFLRTFFSEYKGHILPVFQELFSKVSVLEHFLKKSDAETKDLVLRELSGERYDEFVQWSVETENFFRWMYPDLDKTLLEFTTRISLYRLLINKNNITVGVFSFLELVFEKLKQQERIVLTEDFILLLEKYKGEGKGSFLFIKALERMEHLWARKEREKFLEEITIRKNQEKREDITLEGRLLIHNAGIVLAGPFLYRYFDRLGMLENQKFKTEEMAYKAVQLTQFLATGTTEMKEHELVLNKILCGVKLDSLIEHSFTITEEEKEVSESLLGGMMANWNKLKSDSIDALREGFLMRQGYLEETESGWNLEVERKAMDLLVDFIPWSFSLLKLSWMEKSLTTKWKKSLVEF